MIKCNIKFGKKLQIEAKGTSDTLAKELMLITREIYHSLKMKNESAAEDFRKLLFAFLIDPNSPLFKNPDDSEQPEK